MNTEQIFSNLCENALDFLEKSIDDLNTQPKYALIHFSSAVELFLKARLLREHWTLIVEKNPDLDKFKRGDLRSVSHFEAMNRLAKIVDDPVNSRAKQSFEKVISHRNRVVHFYHADEHKDLNKFKADVASDLCLAIYYLQQTLKKWGPHFADYEGAIGSTFFKVRRIRKFLDVKFKEISPEIEKRKKTGWSPTTCNHCSFQSVFDSQVSSIIFESSCLVCGLNENHVFLPCPECGAKHKIRAYDGFQMINCDCGFLIEQSDFQENASTEPWRPKSVEPLINCGECGSQYVVVSHEGLYLCTECIAVSDIAGLCDWCNERQLGFSDEFSYVSGCNFCDGQIGWRAED